MKGLIPRDDYFALSLWNREGYGENPSDAAGVATFWDICALIKFKFDFLAYSQQ